MDKHLLQEPGYARTRIKDWPANERPREKLLKQGPGALTDAELLALLIRTGTGKQTAIDLAKSMLSRERTLRSIGARSASELMRIPGIGEAKSVELLAAFEIGRRVQAAKEEERLIVRSPGDVAQFMVPRLRDLSSEVFYVLVL